MTEQETLLDIKQAASFLNVSETSLRRWTNERLLPCLRVGRRRERRFRRADLLAFMEDQPVAAAERAARVQSQAADTGVVQGLHLCMIYTSASARNDSLTRFYAEGLRAGHHCFFYGTGEVYSAVLEQLRSDAGVSRADLSRVKHVEYEAKANAQFEAIEAEFSLALKAGAPGIYSAGDVPGYPPDYPLEEIVANERAFDRVAHKYRVTTLCMFDAGKFTSLQLLASMHGHHDMQDRPLSSMLV